MIDNFALGLAHVLMVIAAWRLLRRPDLDHEGEGEGGGGGGGESAPRKFGREPRA